MIQKLRLPFILLALAFCLARGPGRRADLAAQEAAGAFVFSRAMAGTYLAIGEDETRISFAQGDHVRPRLLPGGKGIVLNSNRGGRPGVWSVDTEGANLKRLCDGDQVSVAPDGRYVAFRRNGAIVRRELASGAEIVLSPQSWVLCSCPSFCPDGRVLFLSGDPGTTTICRADVQNPGSVESLLAAEAKSAPRCSPDGERIAYQDGAHIWLLETRTQRRRCVTFSGGVQSWPMWSQDGRSLAYLQSPSPLDGPWHVYRMALEDPRHASLILRDVEVCPDWNGLGFTEGVPSDRPADSVSLRQTEPPLPVPADAAELPTPEGGWGVLAPEDGTTSGDVLVECEWGGLYLSAATGKALLAQRQGEALAVSADLRLVDGRGTEATRISSVDVLEPGRGDVRLEATFGFGDGTSMAATIGVSRVRPLLELRPPDGSVSVLVRRALELAVVPDRVAHDLVYQPSDYDQPAVAVPYAPFLLGLTAGTPGVLMVVTPTAGQAVELIGVQGQPLFAGARVQCKGEAVQVSFMPGEDLWQRLSVVAAEQGEGWDVVWSNPFPAQWRVAVPGTDTSLSMMVPTDTPTTEERVPLEESPLPGDVPPSAVSYVYGRSQNTPLEQAMPMDMLWEGLGLDRVAALLDTEGIRTYRHADQWVPYKDPRAALKVISWIRQRRLPETQQKIDDVCRDIMASLRGLDARMTEYESFVGWIRGLFGQELAQDMPPGLPEWAGQQLSALDARLGERSITPLTEVAEKTEAFRADPDAPYTPFSACVTRALAERQADLAAYRAFAKSVRDKAGLVLARSPEGRGVCEAVRDLAGQYLRHRYYLEGDWLGEEPLGGPEVSYEQIKDL